MSRLTRPLFAIALLACASLARAESLRLAAPAPGATLSGGSFAEIRWTATELPAGAEEWEAFLSLDGGKYYAFRITPHLDLALRRFTFVVPNVDTGDARILIRTGNEVRETLFEFPARFVIARDARAEETLPRVLHFGRAEAAREGDPAVLAWASGDRNGADLAQQSAPAAPPRAIDRRAKDAGDAAAVIVTSPGKRFVSVFTSEAAPPAARAARASESERLPIAVDLLLVCRRRNV